MSSFGEIVFSLGGVLLRVYSLLLLIGQIFAAVYLFRMKARVFAAVQLILGLCWFCLLLDGSYYADWVEKPRVYPAPVNHIYSSPWIFVAAVNLLLTALLALSVYLIIRNRRLNLSRGVIKETLDMLPVGICFSKADGTVVLKNLQIEKLCSDLTGGTLLDASEFWEKVEENSEIQNNVRILPLSNGEAVMLTKDEITSNGKAYAQIIACDVTEQYRITTELKSNNKKLIDLQTRFKAFSAMTSQLAMTEEILKARMTVHDEMGHLLLAGKYYLDEPQTSDAEKLMELERYTHHLLMREGEEPDDAKPDDIGSAVEIARAIGVKVRISGDLPENDTAKMLIGQAIRECAANTVKHADGNSLDVAIVAEHNEIEVTLTGSGNAPAEPITEAGGLLMLRRRIEAAGGTMNISYSPQVTVTLRLPQ